MKKIIVLCACLFIVSALLFQLHPKIVTPQQTHIPTIKSSFITHTAHTFINVDEEGTIQTSDLNYPTFSTVIDTVTPNNDGVFVQAAVRGDTILYVHDDTTVIAHLATNTSSTIPFPIDELLLSPDGNQIARVHDHGTKTSLSVINDGIERQFLTIPKPQPTEKLFLAWSARNTIWYSVIPMIDDGGGTLYPADSNIFYELDMKSGTVVQKIANIQTLTPSPYRNELLKTIARSNTKLDLILTQNGYDSLLETIQTDEKTYDCQFSNEDSILCNGMLYSNGQFYVRLYGTLKKIVHFERMYDSKKFLPSFLMTDSFNDNLYMVNRAEDGVLYKERIQ